MANGTWSEMTLAGHTGLVYEPATLSAHGYTVIFLHGLHQHGLRGQPAFVEQFDRHGLRVVCPQAGRSWWADRVCPEFDPQQTAFKFVLEQLVPSIGQWWDVRPPQIALLGVDMGGQGALRLSFKHPDTFPVVAAIAPAIDYYLQFDSESTGLSALYSDAEAARQDSAILHIHPLYWPRNIWFCCHGSDFWHTGTDRLHMKLSALGIPHQCDLESAPGRPGVDYAAHMAPSAIDFLHQQLERERLRVP